MTFIIGQISNIITFNTYTTKNKKNIIIIDRIETHHLCILVYIQFSSVDSAYSFSWTPLSEMDSTGFLVKDKSAREASFG